MHTEKSFRNLDKSNRNQTVFTIWNQTDFRLVPNQPENGVNTIIWFQFHSIRFRKDLSVCNCVSSIFRMYFFLVGVIMDNCRWKNLKLKRGGTIKLKINCASSISKWLINCTSSIPKWCELLGRLCVYTC